ncbi:MAG: hypothetical protein A3A96_02605 [Candidatus Zambryskibacteria bacterium RIFCSPLOWO2_01_FULL_39_39]|uniref:Uncharacterized protein n=1 Tax=Candidatus Zambryskibacteria bacterium RIFCSPLOWO2_01_FULL_39_39 TaxID=1802758 RepID=A0A1G2TZH5_9BACT|nr:MAG: hypothetical protein A2644_02320 [Candidatus Zambryskibacteria bacterium RIFCSPHIGHO2_01_FULL_39_63]OHA94840.1 MAG: hypothetical protein A3B88_04365 [Candidatus Zambryskibacteria bacterium RIFCSPHIGHO2_02_FULL_39_19]OHA98330.1 MAG: hypothetical protein A3F20_02055 [Candidatus Zambryskibacteria bacterium RIFCSPHIGHO2_12_FULL_39_21]OHB02715.1 MAG: hypothetical protein A3A96_02605 [Candidatus Zambryskibacteria bacterium RIFCSPLOWO2_01_FULL_39_39]
MNEEKLVKLLKEHFPTKKEFGDLAHTVNGISEEIKTIKFDIKEIRNDIEEIKPSIKALDKILEENPIERIGRLEKHNNLPIFIPTSQED